MTTQTEMAGSGKKTYYTQSDFEKIINQGICYSIPVDILQTIRDIDNRIKQKAIIQQKNYENKRFHVPKNNGHWKDNKTDGKIQSFLNSGSINSKTVREFKPTTIISRTEITNNTKIIQRIKLSLNKLSQQNFEKLQKEIVEDIDVLLTEWETTDNEKTGYNLINELFHIISKTTDVKMSELYAKCYLFWVQYFENSYSTIFKQVIDEGIKEYCSQLNEFKLMDPEKDGETYCKYNRFVSEHRGKIMFLIHYAKQQGEIIGKLFTVLHDNLVGEIESIVEDKEVSALKKMFVDEWTEHVVLFLNLGGTIWVDYSVNSYFVKIQGVLETLSKTDVRQYPNMTVKSKFKLQGVLTSLK